MWLNNVAGKLQKKLYQTVGEFVSDVQLIFSNSALYNQVRNSVFHKLYMNCRVGSFHHVHIWY